MFCLGKEPSTSVVLAKWQRRMLIVYPEEVACGIFVLFLLFQEPETAERAPTTGQMYEPNVPGPCGVGP